MSNRRTRMRNKAILKADREERERQEQQRKETEAPVPPVIEPVPVQVVETRGVTAVQLWHLCRERGCVLIPNYTPDNDEGRGLLQARLLCLGYALAFDNGTEKDCLLCIPPEGRKSSADFFPLGKLFSNTGGWGSSKWGGLSFWTSEPNRDSTDSSPVTEYWRTSISDDDLLWMGGGWCSLFNGYAYRELEYSFTGPQEGEFIFAEEQGFPLPSFETGLYRLDDYSAEEQEAFSQAAQVRPSFKPSGF